MAHKILMVEDDFALAMGTEYALTSEGYAVTTAGNLAQAREKFDDSIDLVHRGSPAPALPLRPSTPSFSRSLPAAYSSCADLSHAQSKSHI